MWQFPNSVLQDYVMDFDGSSDYISLSDDTLINTTSPFSISGWFNLDSIDSGGYSTAFALKTNSNHSFVAYINSQGGYAGIAFGEAESGNAINTSTNVSSLFINKWANLTITYNGSGIGSSSNYNLYINGQAQTLTSNSGFSGYGNVNLLGYYHNTGFFNGFNGSISNFVLWNSDQSTNKDNIYNNGSPQTTYTVTPQNWWKLNADSVYTPSAPNYTTALDFVASQSDDIDVGMANFTATNGTISLWFNPTTATNTQLNNFIIGRNVGGNNAGDFGLLSYSSAFSGFAFYMEDGTNSSYCKSNSNFAPDNWVHFAVTWQSGVTNGLIMYINGVAQSVTGNGLTLLASASSIPINIGGNNGISNFNGKISNTAIYNSALTASQVSTLFNFGTPETNISFSPQAWWKLNDQTAITDSSGNGNTGTNNGATNSPGGVAFTPSWKIPSALTIPTVNYTSALEFNNPTTPNNNEYVDIGTISFLNQAGDFTISQWVNPANVTGNNHMTIQFGTLSNFIYLKGNAWQYEFRGYPFRQYVPTNGVPVPKGEWIHIALTVEGTVSKFYQNGDLKHTGVVGTTYSANAVRIGNYYSAGYPWYGQISNTALFNSALSSSNVTTLYNNGQPEATPSFSPLHWWKLDNTTTGIQDSVGSSNGTLVQTSTPGAQEVTTNVYIGNIPVNGVSTTLPSTALQQSDLQFDSPYSNYSLKFDGNSYIDTNFTLPASYTSFSYSFWFKRTTSANPADTEYLIGNGISPGNNNQFRGGVKFRTYGGVVNLSIFGGDNTSTDYNVFPFVNATTFEILTHTETESPLLAFALGTTILVRLLATIWSFEEASNAIE